MREGENGERIYRLVYGVIMLGKDNGLSASRGGTPQEGIEG